MFSRTPVSSNPNVSDTEALDVLVRDHWAMVLATARSVTQDAGLAEDVAQETFVAFARRRTGALNCVAAWLYRVAWRKARNALRGEIRRMHREAEAAAAFHQEIEERPAVREWEPSIAEAMKLLPEGTNQLLVAHFWEGRSQKELATERGVSQSTVSRLLVDALHTLRSCLRSKEMLGVVTFASTAGLAPNVKAAPASVATILRQPSTSSSLPAGASKIALPAPTLLYSMKMTHVILAVAVASLVAVAPLFLPQQPQNQASAAQKPSSPMPSAGRPSREAKTTPQAARETRRFRPVAASQDVRAKVEAIIRHCRGMSLAELKTDSEIKALGVQFVKLINEPRIKQRVDATIKLLKETQPDGARHGDLQMDFEKSDEPFNDELGRAWLEAILSDNPDRVGDWVVNRLQGAAFEFALEPDMDRSSEGVHLGTQGNDKPTY